LKGLATGDASLLGVPSVVKIGDQDGITLIGTNLLTIRFVRTVDRDRAQTDLCSRDIWGRTRGGCEFWTERSHERAIARAHVIRVVGIGDEEPE
jgi:hypothetical protein